MITDFTRADNEHRPPERRRFTSTTSPLIVTGTFVSRVDDTPHGERPHDAGSSKGWDGEEITQQTVLAQSATHEFVRRYVQMHHLGSTQDDPEGSRMDAVSILAFGSMNDLENYLVSPNHAAIAASEAALAGEWSEWWTAVNYSVINRLLPELTTAR